MARLERGTFFRNVFLTALLVMYGIPKCFIKVQQILVAHCNMTFTNTFTAL